MGFKIHGPKAATLGQFKPQCEAWVDAFLAGDQFACGRVRSAIEAQTASPERDTALAYLDKKAKTGVKTTVAPPLVKKTPIDTMRMAVNLLKLSRRPFAEALLEGVRDRRVTEATLAEIKSVCDIALDALRNPGDTSGRLDAIK